MSLRLALSFRVEDFGFLAPGAESIFPKGVVLSEFFEVLRKKSNITIGIAHSTRAMSCFFTGPLEALLR